MPGAPDADMDYRGASYGRQFVYDAAGRKVEATEHQVQGGGRRASRRIPHLSKAHTATGIVFDARSDVSHASTTARRRLLWR